MNTLFKHETQPQPPQEPILGFLTLNQARQLFAETFIEILSDFFDDKPKTDNREYVHGSMNLAKVLGLSRPVVDGMILRNEIPYYRVSKTKILFVLEDVLVALKNGKEQPANGQEAVSNG